MRDCVCLGWTSKCLLNKKNFAEGENLEVRCDEINSKKFKTNQKECPDQKTFLHFSSKV